MPDFPAPETASASDLADAVRRGDVKATELLDHFADRIGAVEPSVNAWVATDLDSAREQAAAVDALVAAGRDPGVLAGLPIGVKDVDDVAGFRTTYGSLVHAGDAPATADTTHIGRLRSAGAVIVGKLATSEFGSVAFTATRANGVTRNPWDLSRTPGGSSGGSSAAVAAGMVPLATGGDGGGSIRIPASYTNVVGFKPSFGRVPFGPRRFDWAHMVQRGPLGRTVRDVARYVDVAAGASEFDRASMRLEPLQGEAAIGRSLAGKRVLWTDTMGFGVCDPAVAKVSRQAAERLIETAGLVEVERDLSWPDPMMAWMVHMGLGLAADLAGHWPDCEPQLTPTVAMSMAALTGHVSIGQVTGAILLREEFERQATALFSEVDFLLSPATATPAFAAEGPMPTEIAGRSVSAVGSVVFTYPFNVTGQPGISVPAGFTDGLPVGLQVVGAYGADEDVLAAGAVAEATSEPWRPAPSPFPGA